MDISAYRQLGTDLTKFISRTSRALITRSRLEMDIRLDHCGRRLGSFLEDDLSDTHLGLTSAARTHLDKFRSFLQSHFVAKLGYYPPTSCADKSAAFPKNIYGQMLSDFQRLYEFLAEKSLDSVTNGSQQGGICVVQSVQAFDQRHKYLPLPYAVPLLPEFDECSSKSSKSSKAALSKRLTWNKADKLKPDTRLVAYSAITKATNRQDAALYDCGLVRAYKGFEKEAVFSKFSKTEKNDKLSVTVSDFRKLLITLPASEIPAIKIGLTPGQFSYSHEKFMEKHITFSRDLRPCKGLQAPLQRSLRERHPGALVSHANSRVFFLVKLC